jgi:hypothetical protein
MGLIIKSTEEKKVTIQGTDIELLEVYGRLEFAGRADGVTIEVAVSTYASKQAFKESASVLSTSVQQGSFTTEIKDGESQSVETAHTYAKQAFEQLGFDVEIDL